MKAASRIGVSGWVRNRADGTVEVVAAGTPEALDQLESAIGKGPSFSRVERVDKDEVSLDTVTVKSFEIQ